MFRLGKDRKQLQPLISPDELSVTGERHYKESIEHLIRTHAGGKLVWRTIAVLSRDTKNEFAKFAVEIQVDGHRIGYIHRDHCERVWQLIGPNGIQLDCCIRWNGEPSHGVYDVKLFAPL